jgi:hypothetical protein
MNTAFSVESTRRSARIAGFVADRIHRLDYDLGAAWYAKPASEDAVRGMARIERAQFRKSATVEPNRGPARRADALEVATLVRKNAHRWTAGACAMWDGLAGGRQFVSTSRAAWRRFDSAPPITSFPF